jgi:hypothetical protein
MPLSKKQLIFTVGLLGFLGLMTAGLILLTPKNDKTDKITTSTNTTTQNIVSAQNSNLITTTVSATPPALSPSPSAAINLTLKDVETWGSVLIPADWHPLTDQTLDGPVTTLLPNKYGDGEEGLYPSLTIQVYNSLDPLAESIFKRINEGFGFKSERIEIQSIVFDKYSGTLPLETGGQATEVGLVGHTSQKTIVIKYQYPSTPDQNLENQFNSMLNSLQIN